MKKGFTLLHRRELHSTGCHTRTFLMTIAAAYLMAIGAVVISSMIGKNFFNW